MVIVINSVIGGFNLTLTDSLLLLSDYDCAEWLVKNIAANAPITFEEIVMVMINTSMREHSKVKKWSLPHMN